MSFEILSQTLVGTIPRCVEEEKSQNFHLKETNNQRAEVHEKHSSILVDEKCINITWYQQEENSKTTKKTRRNPLQERNQNEFETNVKENAIRNDEESKNVQIETKSKILCFASSTCGGYLAVADDSGVLHLFKTSSGGIIFSYPIVSNSQTLDK